MYLILSEAKLIVIRGIPTMKKRNKPWSFRFDDCQNHSTLQLPMCYEHLLALSSYYLTLLVGCPRFTEDESKALLAYTPLKVKLW